MSLLDEINKLAGEEQGAVSEAEAKVLMELMKTDEPLLKSELSKDEFIYYVRIKTLSEQLGIKCYSEFLDTFLRGKIPIQRKRVKEILKAMSRGKTEEKRGWFR